jgi:hypothetical protein
LRAHRKEHGHRHNKASRDASPTAEKDSVRPGESFLCVYVCVCVCVCVVDSVLCVLGE